MCTGTAEPVGHTWYRWLEPREDTDEMTSAAQVDSAKEPNRSAPMPAMSPTLSPTLSAGTHYSKSQQA